MGRRHRENHGNDVSLKPLSNPAAEKSGQWDQLNTEKKYDSQSQRVGPDTPGPSRAVKGFVTARELESTTARS